MATKTPLLGLIKPAFNEYKNSWHIPLNANWDLLDGALGGSQAEIQAARGTQTDLKHRLDVSTNPDGSLKPVPEVLTARSSTVYGSYPGPTNLDFTLYDRLNAGDMETYLSRQSGSFNLTVTTVLSSATMSTTDTSILVPGMAIAGVGIPTNSTIVSIVSTALFTISSPATAAGTTTVSISVLNTLKDMLALTESDDTTDGLIYAPSGFLSFTGAQVKVDGSAAPVIANINGYRQVIRTLKTITISWAPGVNYIYLQRNAGGEIYLDRTSSIAGLLTTYTLDGKLRVFQDNTQNFVTSGVRVGDLLDLTDSSANKNTYVVAATNLEDPVNLTVGQVAIKGLFQSTAAGLNYKFTNPLAPSLGATSTPHSLRFKKELNRIYIGRAVFDGTNVTSVYGYALKGKYETFLSISLSGGNFSQAVSHLLGYFPSKLEFYGSQTNDYSTAMDPLSVAEVAGGSTTLQRSVIVNISDTTINVKNATNAIFYKDYSGVSQTTGYLLVRAER